MPLQKQNVDIKFNQGIDRSLDPKLVIPSKFTRLDNLEFDNVDTVRQRPGYAKSTITAVTGSATVSNIRRLMSLGAEVLLESDAGIHAFAQDHVISRNLVPGLLGLSVVDKAVERSQVDYNDIASSDLDQFDVDVCIATQSRLECWVWSELLFSGTDAVVRYKVIDSVTRATVQQGVVASSTGYAFFSPRVVERYVSGGTSTFYIYYAEKLLSNDATVLRMRSLPIANNSKVPGALTSAVDALNGQAISRLGVFDCVYDLFSDRICMSYQVPVTYFVHCRTMAGSDGVTSTDDYDTGLACGPGPTLLLPGSISVSIAVNTAHYMIATFGSGNTIRAFSGNVVNLVSTAVVTSVATPTSPGQLSSMSSPFDPTKVLVFYNFNDYTTPTDPFAIDVGYVAVNWDSSVVASSESRFARGLSIAARPVAYYSTAGLVDICVPVALVSDVQPTVFALKFGGVANAGGFPAISSHTPPRVLARIFPLECGSIPATTRLTPGYRLPTCLGGYSASVHLPFTRLGKLKLEGATLVTPRHLSKAVLNFSLSLPSVEAQRSLFMAGACPMLYDGNIVHEAGFNYFPEGVTGVPGSGSGALTDNTAGASVYQGVFVYEWTDSKGVLHRSAPSSAVSVNMTASDTKITWSCPYLRLTDKPNVNLVLYRTKSNASIFYRDPGTSVTNYFFGMAAVSTVSLTADTGLGDELLYTTGGVVENDAFPSTSVVCLHQNRLFMVMQEEQQWLQYTDEIDERFLAPATTVDAGGSGLDAIYRLRVPPEAGKIVGLASMDEKLIVVCENMTGYFYGQGPDRLGQQNTYSPFEKCLPTLGGLSGAPESLIVCPDGLFFMSGLSGLVLLTRGLTTAMKADDSNAYFGAEVDADLSDSAFSSVKAVNIPTKNQIRWYLGGSQQYLAYDYQQHQWSKGTAINCNGGATVSRGLFWHSDGTDLFSARTTAGGFDSTATITPMVLETAWLNMAGLQGFQRVYQLMLLAQGMSTSTIGIEVGYDYSATYATSIPFAQTGAVDPLQIEFALPRQKCNAVRFRITITPGASGAEAIRLTAFSLSVGIKGGLNRLAAAKRI